VSRATRRVETASASETEALGAELSSTLSAGDVVLVEGDLGAGKTTLVRGASRALGVQGPVTSPTFTIGQRYSGSVPVSHVDLFRIDELEDEDPSLLDDYITADAITFVEWPPAHDEALRRIGPVAVRVRLTHAGGDRREIEIEFE
jgi:tRNA threonylcarbamoyladenosine biosynthesis protein TsaE